MFRLHLYVTYVIGLNTPKIYFRPRAPFDVGSAVKYDAGCVVGACYMFEPAADQSDI